jgi:hypothetical protein
MKCFWIDLTPANPDYGTPLAINAELINVMRPSDDGATLITSGDNVIKVRESIETILRACVLAGAVIVKIRDTCVTISEAGQALTARPVDTEHEPGSCPACTA